MKNHYKILIVSSISFFAVIHLSGCSTIGSNRMSPGSVSMVQTYNEAINGSDDQFSDTQMRDEIKQLTIRAPYDLNYHDQENEINHLFPRLPNPNIVMYVYPHQAGVGSDQVPVPGYFTVFPLYQQVYYAMPGEVIPR